MTSRSMLMASLAAAMLTTLAASTFLGPPAEALTRSLDKDTLCFPGETAIFSCPIGAKRAAVCGAGGRAIYRYGSAGKVELTSRNLRLARRSYSGGGETQIVVANKDYRYILYDRTIRTAFGADGRNAPDMSSGLLVRRGGQTLSSRRCEDDAPIGAATDGVIPTGGSIVPH